VNEAQQLHEKVRSIRVLVVDDEETVLNSTLAFIRKFFDLVEGAMNGEEAITKLQNGAFDLLITDIKMPKMDGNALISKVREDYPNIFIVTMSGTISEESHLKVDPDLFFTKPMNYESAKELMRQLAN
jgi:CheY-like chemotaxis protein